MLSPVIYNVSHCLLWAGFGPCVVSGPIWGLLALELSQTWHFPEWRSHRLQGALPVLGPEKLSLVGEACSPTRCLPSTKINREEILSSSLRRIGVIWSGASPCWVSLHTVRLVVLLWLNSCQRRAGGWDPLEEHRDGGPWCGQGLSWSVGGGTCSPLGKPLLRPAGLEGLVCG